MSTARVVRELHPLFLLVALAGLSTGCQAPGEPTEPTAMRVMVESPDEYDRLWTAAADILRKHYFLIDREDRVEGVMTTLPEISGAWFEWWRPQPQPAYAWWESNLQTIQRQATVTIRPTKQAQEYDVAVQIDRYRYSLEERQIDNPAAALRLYGNTAPTVSGTMPKKGQPTSDWIPLGRDGHMERALLNSMMERYGLPAELAPPPEPAATEPASAATAQ